MKRDSVQLKMSDMIDRSTNTSEVEVDKARKKKKYYATKDSRRKFQE